LPVVVGVQPQLPVGLRPLGVLPVGGDAPPRLADVSRLPPLLNGACFRLLVGGAHPLLAAGLRPACVLPVGDAPPRLAGVSRLPPRLNGACFRLLVGGAHPLLAAELRPAGVLPATTTLVLMLCRYSRRTFRPVAQPRSKMHRDAANV